MTWLSSNPPSVRSLVGGGEYAVQGRSVTNWKAWPKALVFRRALTAQTKLFRCGILRQQSDRFLHRRHELGREDDGGVFLDGDLGHGLQGTELQRHRMLGDDVGGFAELHRRLIFAFGGDDLGTALALGLGFLGHRALHVIGQRDVLDLDRRDLGTPGLGVLVDHILDLVINAGRIRQQLIETETPDHVADRGLADLIDGVKDILDGDHRLFRIGDVIVGHCRDIDRDVVFGNDLLRRDLHGDGTKGHTHHLLDRYKDQCQSGTANARKPTEQEYHPAFVLLQDAQRYEDIDKNRYHQKGKPI